jgi:hypothetical protein
VTRRAAGWMMLAYPHRPGPLLTNRAAGFSPMHRVHLLGPTLGFAVVLSGCSLTATMIPVAGPLATPPAPVLSVHVDGIMGNSGNLTFAMPNGESCKGRWSSAAGTGLSVGAGSLINQYGSTYLSGYSVSAGNGHNPGQALASCTRDRTFQVEFITGAGTAHGFGIGKDSEDISSTRFSWTAH